MIADAPDGKIDLIFTKSVSRFAGNTADSLTAIRKLKDHGALYSKPLMKTHMPRRTGMIISGGTMNRRTNTAGLKMN